MKILAMKNNQWNMKYAWINNWACWDWMIKLNWFFLVSFCWFIYLLVDLLNWIKIHLFVVIDAIVFFQIEWYIKLNLNLFVNFELLIQGVNNSRRVRNSRRGRYSQKSQSRTKVSPGLSQKYLSISNCYLFLDGNVNKNIIFKQK